MEKFKTVKEKKELYIDFSEEELTELGWGENQKLSIDLKEDNTIVIKPWVEVDIDMTDWPRDILELLIKLSSEQDKSVNEVIVDLLTASLNKNDNDKKPELICENGNV